VVGYADHAVIDTSKIIRHETGTSNRHSKIIRHQTGTHHNHRVDGTAGHTTR